MPPIDEDCEAMAAAADNTMRLAQQQKAQANIQKTKNALDNQKKRLNDITKPETSRVG